MTDLLALQSGDLPAPPIMELTGVRLQSVERGRVVFVLEPEA